MAARIGSSSHTAGNTGQGKSGTDASKSSYSSMILQFMCNSQSIYMYLQCSQIYSSASEKRKMTDYSLNSSDFQIFGLL